MKIYGFFKYTSNFTPVVVIPCKDYGVRGADLWIFDIPIDILDKLAYLQLITVLV